MRLLCSAFVACISADGGNFSVLGEDFVTVLSKEHGGQVDLLFVDTNGVHPLPAFSRTTSHTPIY